METRKRVLVVDDEPRILRFLRIALTMAGFEVVTATGGEEALQLARSEKPDIMVLDLVMVPVSGLEVLARLRAFSRLPVLVATARSSLGEDALRAGANDYIGKPFQPDEVIRKIRDVLDRQQAGKKP